MKFTNRMLLILIVFFLFDCINLRGQNSFPIPAFTGTVKSVVEKTYQAAKDSLGGVIKGGEEELMKTYKFRDDGSLVSENVQILNKNFPSHYQDVFDEHENYIKKLRLDKPNEILLENKYDENSKLVKVFLKKKTGASTIYQEFNYDKQGYLLERLFYDTNGQLARKTKIKNNREGFPIVKSRFTASGEFLSKKIFKYNSSNHLIEIKLFDKKNELYEINIYEPDAHGNYLFHYVIKFNSSPIIRNSYAYRYDENNNWIHRISYNGEFPNKITIREID